MRIVALLGALAVVAGCGGRGDAPPRAHAAKAPFVRCTHPSEGFRACTVFGAPGERSALYYWAGAEWVVLRGRLPGRAGWWRRVVAAPDHRTLLAQWSGECESQSTYFVSSSTGHVRPIFRGHTAEIAGWSHPGLARVRLTEAIWRGNVRAFPPGVYLVNPRTLAVRLQNPRPARRGC